MSGKDDGAALRPVGEGTRLYRSVLLRAGVLAARRGMEEALLEQGDGRRVAVAAAPGFGTADVLGMRGWKVALVDVSRLDAWRPLESASMDAVVLVHALAGQDPSPILAEARRILRPRGRLVVIDENPQSLLHRLSPRLRRVRAGARPPLSAAGLRDALTSAGFRRASVRTTSVGLGAAWLRRRGGGRGPWGVMVTLLDPLWVGSTKLHPEWGTQLLGWAMP